MSLERAYLDALAAAMHDPSQLAEAVQVAHGGVDEAMRTQWSDDAIASGLRFYVFAARRRRLRFAETAFKPVFDALTEAAQRQLRERFLAGDAGDDLDWSLNVRGLLRACEAMVREGHIAEEVLELAQHQWRLMQSGLHHVTLQPGGDLSSLRVNPTLELAEYPHGAHLGEANTPVQIVYFLSPTRQRACWRKVDAQLLALLRIVEEAVPLREAARMAQLSVAELEAMLRSACEQGWLVARSCEEA